MSSKFQTEALASLATSYRVEGGQVPVRSVDLDSPVQLVHDVHRLVEIGQSQSAYAGFFNVSISNTHTVPGETVSGSQVTGPTAAFWNTLGLNAASSWLWLLEATTIIGAALTVTEAMVAIQQFVFTGAFTTHQRLLWRATATTTTAPVSGGSRALIPSLDYIVQRPVLVSPGATIWWTTTASGAAVNAQVNLQLWAGPKFVLPPGLA